MKKRCLAMALALVLCVGLAVPALAADMVITEAIPCQYDNAGDFSEGLAAVKVDGKMGFIDKLGNQVIPCQYEPDGTFGPTAGYVFHGGVAFVKQNGKWGLIDKEGNQIAPFQYDRVYGFSEGIAMVGMNKYGFVDQTGREITPCKYDNAEDFSEGLAAVNLDGKWGYIDTTGREVISLQYKEAGSFTKEGAWVCDGEWGLIDKTGNAIIPCTYTTGYFGYSAEEPEFHEGIAVIMKQDDGMTSLHYGAVDATGKTVVPFEYYRIKPFHNGYAVAMYHADQYRYAYAILDKNGERTDIPLFTYLDETEWNDGLFAAMKALGSSDDGTPICVSGYVDAAGREVIPFRYDISYQFSEGLGRVCKQYTDPVTEETISKYGFVDKTGREVVPCKYDYAEDFRDGFAYVGINTSELDVWGRPTQKRGLIDKTGKEVVPCKYDGVSFPSDGMVQVRQNGKSGFLRVSTPQTAYPSTQTVDVDGKTVEFQCYALKEGNGMTNYIKLRDVADALSGSAAQFEVGYYGAVNIATGWAYTPNGSEGSTPFSGQRECLPTIQKVNIDGKLTNLEAFTLTDDAGGGYTYYKLRDLGEAIGFKVDWTAERGIFIETK